MKKTLFVASILFASFLRAQDAPDLDLETLKKNATAAGYTTIATDAKPAPPATPTPVATAGTPEELQQLLDERTMDDDIKAAKKREKGVRRFAADLFDMRQLPGNVTEGGISEDYVLGVGDKMQVNAVGSVSFEIPVQVDGHGEVNIPKVGVVKVSGLPLGRAKAAIRAKVGSMFSKADVSISLTHLRQVRIFILGEVYKSGSFLVPSLSSLVNVLGLSGGPRASGSMRQIKVMRGGKTVHTLDLYPLRAEGEGNMNFYLQSGDTLFVPLAQNQVLLEGSFTRVDLKETDPVIPTKPDAVKTVANLDPGGKGAVRASAIGGQDQPRLITATTPKIMGEAARVLPLMQFELLPGETAADALKFAGGLLPEAYQSTLTLRREDEDGLTNLTDVPGTALAKVELKRGDVLAAFPRRDRLVRSVTLVGWVRVPGNFAHPSGLRVGDLLKRDQQILPDTYLGRGEIVRSLEDGTTRYLAFQVTKAIEGDPANNLLLEDRDRIELFKTDRMRLAKTVTISGPMPDAGVFPLHEGMRVGDLIFQAGVPAKSANRFYAELASSRYGQPSDVRRLDLGKLLSTEDGSPVDLKDDLLNPLLQEDDRLSIYEKPEFRLHRMVMIMGQVARPGTYVLDSAQATLSSLIERAGGLTSEAMPKGGVFYREVGGEGMDLMTERRTYAAGITDILDRLSETKMYTFMDAAGGKVGASTPKLFRPPILHGLDPTKLNRLVVDFELALKKDTEADVEMQDGDSVIIPRRTDSVMIIGETATPFAFYKVRSGMSVGDLLSLAGGVTRNADKSNIRLLKANGRIIDTWVSHRKVEPGDAVLVPQRIRKDVSWQENLNALTPLAIMVNALKK